MQPQLMMTDKDYERLSSLIEWKDSKEVERLWDELSRAQIVSQNEIPKDVVTMNSLTKIKDLENGKESELLLVYPSQANSSLGKVSVLAPIGMALIGLRVGERIDWSLPNGKIKRIEVIDVSYQPEAHGIFKL